MTARIAPFRHPRRRLTSQARISSHGGAGWASTLLAALVLYSLAIPFALLDAWVTAYQYVCFPLLGIALVRRGAYVVIDRHTLRYLSAIEKVNCAYCGYANGVIAFVREVAARTEQYWCPIKHGRPIPAPHSRYHLFTAYGDAAGYRDALSRLRRLLARGRAEQPTERTGYLGGEHGRRL